MMLALLCSSAFAQTYKNNLSSDSVDPLRDSLYIKEVREYLNNIRETQGRPTVALVFSGGGAKGAAQVGALKYLEELRLPVDFVCGTSIGGLIGGLYSVGYRSEDLEELFKTQDWGLILSDRIDTKYISYHRKMDKAKYILAFPFHYRKDWNFGADNDELSTQAGVNTLTSSLPSGFAYGFNVNNIFSSLTVGYQDEQSFLNLPTPFMCVASDVISYKANFWTEGSINTAMRSTMSIPGLFDPVRVDKMVLVDGGTRNNFPADFARAVGADYIIGIELRDADPTFSQVRNVGSVLGQFIGMLGQDSFNANVNYPDVIIKPDLDGFGMLSFNREAVDTMIVRGYNAAFMQSEKLKKIQKAVGMDSGRIKDKATDISETPVKIGNISFEGIDGRESKMMMRTVKLKPGQTVDADILEDAMSKLQATEAFESITYSLLGKVEPFDLVFHCVKGPVHQFGLGFRMDTEDWVSLGFSVGLNEHKFIGSKLYFSGRVGQTQSVKLHYALDLRAIPSLNLEAELLHPKGELYNGSSYKQSFEYLNHQEKVYLSNLKWRSVDFQLGGRNIFYNLSPKTAFGSIYAPMHAEKAKGNVMGLYLQACHYSFDDYYFPAKGSSFNVSANYDFITSGGMLEKPITTAALNWKFLIPLSNNFAIIPDIHFRSVSDGFEPVMLSNFIGGSMAGRYVEQQIPFAGFGNMYMAKNNVAAINFELRARIIEDLYASVIGAFMQETDTFSELLNDITPDIYGGAFEIGYDSLVGPVKFDLRWSQMTKWGAFLSVGFDF